MFRNTKDCIWCGRKFFKSYTESKAAFMTRRVTCSIPCRKERLSVLKKWSSQSMNDEDAKELYLSGMSIRDIAKEKTVGRSIVRKSLAESGISVIQNRLKKSVGYGGGHQRVSRLRGKPRRCEHCLVTDAKTYDWASISKNYADPNDYIRLCRSCHFKMDGVRPVRFV